MDGGGKKVSNFAKSIVKGLVVSALGIGILFLGFWLLYLGFLRPNAIWVVLGAGTILMGMTVFVRGRRNKNIR